MARLCSLYFVCPFDGVLMSYTTEYKNYQLIADDEGCTVVSNHDPFNQFRVESISAARLLINRLIYKLNNRKGRVITWS